MWAAYSRSALSSAVPLVRRLLGSPGSLPPAGERPGTSSWHELEFSGSIMTKQERLSYVWHEIKNPVQSTN
uniref:Putative secreted protein n=1 Tax=Ixodes ricinus TaxID=34613 RepID=A0A6B0U319_IXORI